jgi:hypothetical protein
MSLTVSVLAAIPIHVSALRIRSLYQTSGNPIQVSFTNAKLMQSYTQTYSVGVTATPSSRSSFTGLSWGFEDDLSKAQYGCWLQKKSECQE